MNLVLGVLDAVVKLAGFSLSDCFCSVVTAAVHAATNYAIWWVTLACSL